MSVLASMAFPFALPTSISESRGVTLAARLQWGTVGGDCVYYLVQHMVVASWTAAALAQVPFALAVMIV